MDTTKTRRRQHIALPQALTDILRWHVDRLPDGPMKDSDLLFPSGVGGFHSSSCLDKAFAEVSKAIGLGSTSARRRCGGRSRI